MIRFLKKTQQQQLEIIVCDHFTVLLDESTNDRGVFHAVFDMVISTLRALIWVCSNLILSKVKTTSNNNSSFPSFQSHNKKINAMYSPLNSIVIILAQKLYFNLFGYNGNLDTFLTIDASFFRYYPMNKDNRSTLSIICQILKDADKENYFLDLLTLSCKDVDASPKELYLSHIK